MFNLKPITAKKEEVNQFISAVLLQISLGLANLG